MQLFFWADANEQQQQQATKDTVGRQYEEEIQQAENVKNKLQQELDKEKAMLEHAQEKRKTALKANPWEENQAQIDQINSELQDIESGMLAKRMTQILSWYDRSATDPVPVYPRPVIMGQRCAKASTFWKRRKKGPQGTRQAQTILVGQAQATS